MGHSTTSRDRDPAITSVCKDTSVIRGKRRPAALCGSRRRPLSGVPGRRPGCPDVIGRGRTWLDTVRSGRPVAGHCPRWPEPVRTLSGASRVAGWGRKEVLRTKTPYATAILRCSWRAAPRAEGPARRVFVRLLTQPFSCGGCDPPMPAFRLRFFSFFLFLFFLKSAPLFCL